MLGKADLRLLGCCRRPSLLALLGLPRCHGGAPRGAAAGRQVISQRTRQCDCMLHRDTAAGRCAPCQHAAEALSGL